MKTARNPAANRLHMKHPLILLLLFIATLTSPAQTTSTQATHDDINQWLHSNDPRLVAWGAYFADKNGDQAELPTLAALAEHYHANGPRQYDNKGNYVSWTSAQQENHDSMQAVLDSVIQLHGQASYQAILATQPDFPDQAMVLLATMSQPSRTQAANTVYATRNFPDKPYDWHDYAHQQMVHLAAAILVHDPPPGFTATLLNEATIHIVLTVADDDKAAPFHRHRLMRRQPWT